MRFVYQVIYSLNFSWIFLWAVGGEVNSLKPPSCLPLIYYLYYCYLCSFLSRYYRIFFRRYTQTPSRGFNRIERRSNPSLPNPNVPIDLRLISVSSRCYRRRWCLLICTKTARHSSLSDHPLSNVDPLFSSFADDPLFW